MASSEKLIVEAIDTQRVSHMLALTSLCDAVENREDRGVAKTIPIRGATIKSRSNPPRKAKTSLTVDLCIAILFNYVF